MLPVVCLPGIRGNARIFDPLAEHVDHRVRLRPLDLPPGAPALAAARLRPQLPPGRFFDLTGSYGGLVARFLPVERMAGLACVATLPAPHFLDAAMARRARLLMALPDRMLEPLYRQHGRRSLQAEGVPASTIDALLQRPIAASVLRARLRAVLSGHHGTIPAVPTVWIQGRTDPLANHARTWTADDHPLLQICTVDGGHFPHASHPSALWAALESHGWTGPAARTDSGPPHS